MRFYKIHIHMFAYRAPNYYWKGTENILLMSAATRVKIWFLEKECKRETLALQILLYFLYFKPCEYMIYF